MCFFGETHIERRENDVKRKNGKARERKTEKKQQPSTHRTRAILQNAECIRKTIFKVFSLGFYALTSSYYCRSLKLPTFCHVGVLVFFFFFLYFWKLFCSDEHTHIHKRTHIRTIYAHKYQNRKCSNWKTKDRATLCLLLKFNGETTFNNGTINHSHNQKMTYTE